MNPAASQLPQLSADRRGFTLFELVLVMVLLTTVLAIVTPSVRGFLTGSRSRDAATQFLTLTQFARARAAADSRVYRLSVDGTARAYRMTAQDGIGFSPVGTDFGRDFSLPHGMQVRVERASGSGFESAAAPDSIDFYPDGRSDVAVVRLVDSRGTLTVIACPSPAEPFRVMTEEEVLRQWQ